MHQPSPPPCPHDACATLPTEDPQELARQHDGYARRLAAKVRRQAGLPRYVEQQELEGWALLGLSEAASRFDPARGVPFGAYAKRRIVGAVLNGIGKMHQAPESARQKARRLARSQDALPDWPEGSVEPESASTQLARSIVAVGASILIQRLGDAAEPTDAHTPLDATLQREARRRLHAALNQLEPAQRRLMRMYYFQDKSMSEVGKAMSISTPTVCRRHKDALQALADLLAD